MDFTTCIELSQFIKKEKEVHFYIALPADTCEILFDCLRGKKFYINQIQPVKHDLRIFGLHDFFHEYVV